MTGVQTCALPICKKYATFVVGTSTAGYTAADVDYLCDGTADDVEINAAITALPSTGGEIVILEGTYDIKATININKNNVTIRGCGTSTKLLKTDVNMVEVFAISSSNCCLSNITIDGNSDSLSYTSKYIIRVTGNSNTICNITICNAMGGSNCAISLKSTASQNIIEGNQIYNVDIAISVYSGTNENNNVISNNIYNVGTGISSSGTKNNTIGNNIKNSNYGINMNQTKNSVFNGNCMYDCNTGIFIKFAENCNVSDNVCMRGAGLSSDYSDTQGTITILDGAKNNLIYGNLIMGKNYTNSGTNNTITNNKYQ